MKQFDEIYPISSIIHYNVNYRWFFLVRIRFSVSIRTIIRNWTMQIWMSNNFPILVNTSHIS